MLLIGLFILSLSCQTPIPEHPNSTNYVQDKIAILFAIEKESAAFFEKKYDLWKSTYAETEYAFHAWNNTKGSFDAIVGWKYIDEFVRNQLRDSSTKDETRITNVARKNILFKFYGPNACYLTWDQINSNQSGNIKKQSKELRIMEKINGQWKIVCVAAFWDYNNQLNQ